MPFRAVGSVHGECLLGNVHKISMHSDIVGQWCFRHVNIPELYQRDGISKWM